MTGNREQYQQYCEEQAAYERQKMREQHIAQQEYLHGIASYVNRIEDYASSLSQKPTEPEKQQ